MTVGDYGTITPFGNAGSPVVPVVATRTGSAWTSQRLPARLLPIGYPTGVSCASATSCAAVGYQIDPTVPASVAFVDVLASGRWSASPLTMPAGVPGSLRLAAVRCLSATWCEAVGWFFDQSGTERPVAATFDGIRWTIAALPVPADSGDGGLAAIDCTAVDRCIAVGRLGASGLIEQQSPTGWRAQVLPPPPSSSETALTGVSCPGTGRCIAVGTISGSASVGAVAEAQSGSTWLGTALPLPPTGNPAVTMGGVSCPSPGWCVAVGTNNQMGFVDTLTTAAWSATRIPNPSPGNPFSLSGIACPTVGSCTAVGRTEAGLNNAPPLVETLSNGRWSSGLPYLGQPPSVAGTGVSCASATSCVVVATGYHRDASSYGAAEAGSCVSTGAAAGWAGGLRPIAVTTPGQ